MDLGPFLSGLILGWCLRGLASAFVRRPCPPALESNGWTVGGT